MAQVFGREIIFEPLVFPCLICKTSFKSLIGWGNHLQGSLHRSKWLENPSKLQVDSRVKSYLLFQAEKRQLHEILKLYCEICDVKTTELEPMLAHFNSTKHKKNFNILTKKGHFNPDHFTYKHALMQEIVNVRKSQRIFQCEICSMHFNERCVYNRHLKTKKHYTQLKVTYNAKVILKILDAQNFSGNLTAKTDKS